jgi:hypothetical protein
MKPVQTEFSGLLRSPKKDADPSVPEWVFGPLGRRPALSVRQPWATSIVHFGKPVENRIWTGTYLKAQLSRIKIGETFLIHASQGMEDEDILSWKDHIELRPQCRPNEQQKARAGIKCFDDLPRGGIIGAATFAGWVTDHPSSWFTGPGALLMEQVHPLPFFPCRGTLGFFRLPPVTNNS